MGCSDFWLYRKKFLFLEVQYIFTPLGKQLSHSHWTKRH